MEHFIVYAIALVAGFYMAWNIGANDVANAMGTSVGSKAISIKGAVIVAAIFEFAGAVFVGSHVTQTISKGIVDPVVFSDIPYHFVIGMLSALIAAGIWLQLATFLGLPVSTTHSIVGAVLGFGIVSKGIACVKWGKIFTIVMSWIVSPLFGAIIAFLTFRWVSKHILSSPYPARATRRHAPYLVFMVVFIVVLSIFYKGLKNLHLDLPLWKAIIIASIIAFLCAVGTKIFIFTVYKTPKSRLRERLMETEEIFKVLQLMTACYMAFAHGANDVANATGPLAGIIMTLREGVVLKKAYVPGWVLFIGGIGIVIGLATWGYKVIETVGKKITEITPSRGFCAEFGCATTVLVCSKLGLPISTTHTLVGAVIGVGLARGMGALNLKVVRDIINSWIITIPFTAGLCAIIFSLLKAMFL